MSYDLTTEPWIPVRWCDGKVGPEAVGLCDALTQAHRIREVTTESPLQTVALYRLLQALFLRLYPESGDEATWMALWEQGHFDVELVSNYFDQRRERFDLLHPKRPFYGHPNPPVSETSTVAKLFEFEASKNNPTLFDHTTDADVRRLSPDRAARGVVALQATALAGGRSHEQDKWVYYANAPLVTGTVFWLQGNSLFDALLLNSPPTAEGRIQPDDDEAAWEREGAISAAASRSERGYVDYLTWQSRFVSLIPEDEEGRSVLRLSQGEAWDSTTRDPLMAVRISKEKGEYPLKIRPGRSLWRDAHVLLGSRLTGHGSPPPTFNWLTTLELDYGIVPEDGSWNADAFGLGTGDGSVIHRSALAIVRHERMPVYPAVLRSLERQRVLEAALGQAERQANNLRVACRACADVLAGGDAERLKKLTQALGALPRYWATLGAQFDSWLDSLARLEVEEGEYDALTDVSRVRLDAHLAAWTRDAFNAARDAYRAATRSFTASPRHFKAVARGEHVLRPVAAFKDALSAT